MKKYLKIIFPILILILGSFGFILLKVNAPANKSKPLIQKNWPVTVGKIKFKDIRPTIYEFGNIVAGNKVDLRALVSGPIISVDKS